MVAIESLAKKTGKLNMSKQLKSGELGKMVQNKIKYRDP